MDPISQAKLIEKRLRAQFPDCIMSAFGHGTFRIEQPLNFETLMRISEALGTMKFTVEGFKETTYYSEYTVGDAYGLEFTYDPKDIPEKLEPEDGEKERTT